MMSEHVHGTMRKATRAFPSALALAASTAGSPERAAVPCSHTAALADATTPSLLKRCHSGHVLQDHLCWGE